MENIINWRREEGQQKQKKFVQLSKNEQEKKIKSDYDYAIEIKENVRSYISPEKIVHGLHTEGIARMSEAFKNKPLEDYGKEHSSQIGENYRTPFMDFAIAAIMRDKNINSGIKSEKLKNLFSNIPIIDLGAGTTRHGYILSRILGASGYIAVEPFNSPGTEEEFIDPEYPSAYKNKLENTKMIPFSIVPEDALAFLKRLPDHSVGILTAGTDAYVMFGKDMSDENKKKVEEYISAVNKEIVRVLHPQSALLTIESVFGKCDNLVKSEEESIVDDNIYVNIFKTLPAKTTSME